MAGSFAGIGSRLAKVVIDLIRDFYRRKSIHKSGLLRAGSVRRICAGLDFFCILLFV